MAVRGYSVLRVYPHASSAGASVARVLPLRARRSGGARSTPFGPFVAILALLVTLAAAVLTGHMERTPSIRYSTALGLPHANR
ncbi:MAG TPA: hypothetical protein VLV45_12050 [Gemmatimonadales bacterium]|nr:hypothetical protein [Gemmatimonadales bacterium]